MRTAQCLLIHTPEYNLWSSNWSGHQLNSSHSLCLLVPKCADLLLFLEPATSVSSSPTWLMIFWSSLCLQSSPSDPQSLTPSHHSDYAQMLFPQKYRPGYLCIHILISSAHITNRTLLSHSFNSGLIHHLKNGQTWNLRLAIPAVD